MEPGLRILEGCLGGGARVSQAVHRNRERERQ